MEDVRCTRDRFLAANTCVRTMFPIEIYRHAAANRLNILATAGFIKTASCSRLHHVRQFRSVQHPEKRRSLSFVESCREYASCVSRNLTGCQVVVASTGKTAASHFADPASR